MRQLSSISGPGYFVAMYHQDPATESNPVNVWPQPYAVQETEGAFIPSKARRLAFFPDYKAARTTYEAWIDECRLAANRAEIARLEGQGVTILRMAF